jgi:hypothetical protein
VSENIEANKASSRRLYEEVFGQRNDAAADEIVEAWFLPDRMTLWRQLGLFPGPPTPATRA